MTPKERAAMQQAIHKINQATALDEESDELLMEALAILREALDHSGEANEMVIEQAEQEPVAYAGMLDGSVCAVYTQWPVSHYHEIKPLYAAPVRTKDLTDDDLRICFKSTNTSEPLAEGWQGLERFARAVIAADREKNK